MAKRLIDILEDVTEAVHNAFFVDLFVRVSNAAAITMYNKVRDAGTDIMLKQDLELSEDHNWHKETELVDYV